MNELPKVGDVVKITYYGIVTAVRDTKDGFLPHFELNNAVTRHPIEDIVDWEIYDDASTALQRSMDRRSR